MDFSAIDPALLVAAIMVSATPIILAALGELVVERSGVLNLGVEGMMIFGAVIGFASGFHSGSPELGFLAAAVAGAAMAMVFGLLTQVLQSNQVATGLGLTMVGLGLSSLIGKPYDGQKGNALAKMDFGVLSDLPFFGPAIFSHDPMVYLSLLLVLSVSLFLWRTRAGLVLRAVGENHNAAHSLGYKVIRIRLMALAFGGACAGLGGAYLALVRLPQWTEGVTAGAGWIALAIVVFASWKPGRLIIGAYLFGGITVLQLNLQAAGATWGVEYLSMSPYLVTILVLVLITYKRSGGQHNAPASLGHTFHASQ